MVDVDNEGLNLSIEKDISFLPFFVFFYLSKA